MTLAFAMLIPLPAIVLRDPLTILSFAPREMFFCAESFVPCPQMIVLNSPYVLFLYPHTIVEFFHFPVLFFPPNIVDFSPSFSMLFSLPTMIVAFAPEI